MKEVSQLQVNGVKSRKSISDSVSRFLWAQEMVMSFHFLCWQNLRKIRTLEFKLNYAITQIFIYLCLQSQVYKIINEVESLLQFIHGIWKYFATGSVTERKWVVHTLMQVKTLRVNFLRVSGERLSTFSLSNHVSL